MTTSDLAERSLAFAREVQELLDATIPGERTIVSVKQDDRYSVRPEGDSAKTRVIPLTVNGQHLAQLSVLLLQELDRTGEYLKTTRTDFRVLSTLDRTPLVRHEYRADMHTDPIAHWQFHAERGSFSHLLSIAHAAGRVENPHDLSNLHLPVGGERFRPCLEDLIEFLIRDCGIDHVHGWERAVQAGREAWRRRQFRASVRDLQSEAAATLADYGWRVEPPPEVRPEHVEPYRKW
ncbi:hypothetical protein [Georgenia alba]|uniref:Uncharacterized protein n=1 Tax=Georgenia alba TaxID=2233858 RepID=A0ABW2Q5S8_9MICO